MTDDQKINDFVICLANVNGTGSGSEPGAIASRFFADT